MCGRTACALAPDDICKATRYNSRNGGRQKPAWKDAPGGKKYYPSHNIAPASHTPVMLSSRHYRPGEIEEGVERVIQPMKWGLVPSWHKGDPYKLEYETNNCRSEGMLTKRTYKVPLEKGQRCVILAEGFFEWKRSEKNKQPYFIYFPKDNIVKIEPNSSSDSSEIKNENEWKGNKLLTMAGVFEIWKPPDGSDEIYSYSIITVDSSPAMAWIHHRMPAILSTDEEINEWLDFGNVPLKKACKLIRPTESVTMHPVSSIVNNSRNKSPDCVLQIDPQKPKKSASSNFMMSWLGKKTENKSNEEPSSKRQKTN
ncbi:hypothetical protein LOTGIDRAFT_211838 [Lottia gigantea]|uniref:Abasic site processing protein HMCES n=1 Tax=Lottia gigantea TaxID=225164 RepID=V4BBR4_LOTGI|nr:hypothetical protein LOTGIDRAFT_211838 [Lottia gigantea]ESP05041.1 hypothetical protein LOTGIDRAFT_211838 [Lottia gigantea]